MASIGSEQGAMDPTAFLTALGVHDCVRLEEMTSGLGGTHLWRVHRGTGSPDLVLRVFPGGADQRVEREAVAHRAARSGGVPAPEVINTGRVGDDGALLMAWAAGSTVLKQLALSDDDEAHRIGIACGHALARLHLTTVLTATREALGRPGDWMSWGGEESEQLRGLLSELSDRPAAMLHLDFHPENILIDDGEVTAVIDWANARLGPPAADLARSRSIHWLINLHPGVTPQLMRAIDHYELGLLQGHRELFGRTDHSPAIQAWALAVQYADLSPMINIEGAWVGEETLQEIQQAYRRLLAVALP